MKARIYKSQTSNLDYIDIEVFDAKVTRVLNGRDDITFSAVTETYEDFPIGSRIVADIGTNRDYFLNELPGYDRKAENLHEYTFKFEAPVFQLKKVSYLDVDNNAEFFLNGRLSDFVSLMVANVIRSGASYVKFESDVIPETEYKNIQFNNQNCWQVLNTLCDEYDLEFYINVEFYVSEFIYKISFYKKVGNVNHTIIEYGKRKGLKNLKRTNVNNDELITRLHYRGSDANLPTDYPHKRLRGSYNYIDENIAQFGIHEGIKVFEEIKPSYIGNVSGYSYDDVKEEYLLIDSGFPFDLKEKDENGDTKYLINGTTAKINFRTGNLAGYTFDIKDYDHETHTFKLIPFDEENGYRVPNDTVSPSSGNEYVVFDINLPDVYLSDASAQLDIEAAAYLALHSSPRVKYVLESDATYFNEFDVKFDLGDQISVYDTELNISPDCRAIEISFPLFDRNKQTIVLSDVRFVVPTRKTQMRLNTIERFVENNKLFSVQKTLKSQKTTDELKSQVFDYKDNYFVPENNRPESLDPYMLALDSGEIQFSLKSASIEANVGADPLAVKVGDGELIHHSFFGKTRAEIEKLKENEEDYDPTRSWTIAEQTLEAIDPAAGYYVYAKIPLAEIETAATIVLDTEHIVAKRDVEFNTETKKVEGYIHYKLGYLSEVTNNKRTLNQLWSESGSDKTFEHEQTTPADVWTVEHKLGKCPAVTVIDTAGSVVEGKIDIIDVNRVQLTFNAAFSGKAYFN